MNLYAEIDTITPAPRGLIVSALLSGADAAAKRMELADRAVAEMAAADPVGEVTDLRLLDDSTLIVRALIEAPGAVEKVNFGVLRHLMLTVARDGKVERIALVDRPDAFGKRAGAGHTAAAPLRLSQEEPKMLTLRDCVDVIHQVMDAPAHRRAAVLDDALAKTATRTLRGAAPAPVTGGILCHADEVALMIREEQDRAEHRRRLTALGKTATGQALEDTFATFKRDLAGAPQVTPAWADGEVAATPRVVPPWAGGPGER